MAKTRKKSKIVGIVVYIIILVLVIGAVGFFYYNTDGFKTGVRTLYIACDDKIVDSNVVELIEGQEYTFDIVSLADLGDKSAIDYDVRIAPNLDVSGIRYTINNEEFINIAKPDYSAAFEVTKNARGFTIKQPEWDIVKILSKVNDGATVELPYDVQPGVYFCAVVTIGKKQIRFDLTAKLTDLEFDKGVAFE